MPTISFEQRNNAVEFMRVLNNLLNFVDEVSGMVAEGKYLEAMNDLKFINDYRIANNHPNNTTALNALMNEVRTNETVVLQNRRQYFKIRNPKLSDAEKLATGKYQVCSHCDSVIKKTWYPSHLETTKCGVIENTKKRSVQSGEADTSETQRVSLLTKRALILTSKKYWLDRLGNWNTTKLY